MLFLCSEAAKLEYCGDILHRRLYAICILPANQAAANACIRQCKARMRIRFTVDNYYIGCRAPESKEFRTLVCIERQMGGWKLPQCWRSLLPALVLEREQTPG